MTYDVALSRIFQMHVCVYDVQVTEYLQVYSLFSMCYTCIYMAVNSFIVCSHTWEMNSLQCLTTAWSMLQPSPSPSQMWLWRTLTAWNVHVHADLACVIYYGCSQPRKLWFIVYLYLIRLMWFTLFPAYPYRPWGNDPTNELRHILWPGGWEPVILSDSTRHNCLRVCRVWNYHRGSSTCGSGSCEQCWLQSGGLLPPLCGYVGTCTYMYMCGYIAYCTRWVMDTCIYMYIHVHYGYYLQECIRGQPFESVDTHSLDVIRCVSSHRHQTKSPLCAPAK